MRAAGAARLSGGRTVATPAPTGTASITVRISRRP